MSKVLTRECVRRVLQKVIRVKDRGHRRCVIYQHPKAFGAIAPLYPYGDDILPADKP